MRYLTLYLILFLLPFQLSGQPCFPQTIILSTQSQVDSFRIAHPNCTQIVKDLIISGEDITQLDSLLGLDFIGRDLIIAGNTNLPTLRGLDSLVVVGRHLKIQENLTLFDVTGLNALQSVIGQLWIRANPGLQNLDGLENLVGITGNFRLEDNMSLSDISGLKSLGAVGGNLNIINNDALPHLFNLRKLGSVGGSLQIVGNDALTQVSDLSHLVSIGGHLIINNNTSLQSVMGFIHLTSINGYLYVRNNPMLTDLLGLDNIDPASILYLFVRDNAVLSMCSVASVCDYLDMGVGPYFIGGNPVDCANAGQVTALCALLPVRLVSFEARAGEAGVTLAWATGQEENNLGFSVQRSRDAQSWETLAFVPAAGGTAGASYLYVDEKPLRGTSFYRLEQLDADGRVMYSSVAPVVWNDAFRQISLHPNPVTDLLWVEGLAGLSANEDASYVLYDHTGHEVLSGILIEGMAVNLGHLPAGLYWIAITIGGQRQMFKVARAGR